MDVGKRAIDHDIVTSKSMLGHDHMGETVQGYRCRETTLRLSVDTFTMKRLRGVMFMS